jgi:hypothetical protein
MSEKGFVSQISSQTLFPSVISYAGNYVLELVEVIVNANQPPIIDGQVVLNIQGLAVGNPTIGKWE